MPPTHDRHTYEDHCGFIGYIGYIYVGTLFKELVENSGIEHKFLD
jgi:hypothetical protein